MAAPAQAQWISSSSVLNPVASTVLVDTGPQAADTCYVAQIIVGSSVNAVFVFERRNVANTATLQSLLLPVQAFDFRDPQLKAAICLLAGERYRVINNGALTGTVQASLFLQ